MEFNASLDSLEKIMKHIRSQAEALGVAPAVIRKIELVTEEAVVNIISYGYKDKKGKIRIGCETKNERFHIILRDNGVPFNPIEVEIHPQVDAPLHERKVGGFGIYMIRKMIDEVSYQREGNENVLRLAFNLY